MCVCYRRISLYMHLCSELYMHLCTEQKHLLGVLVCLIQDDMMDAKSERDDYTSLSESSPSSSTKSQPSSSCSVIGGGTPRIVSGASHIPYPISSASCLLVLRVLLVISRRDTRDAIQETRYKRRDTRDYLC
jgi:hypothetical protein